MTKENPDIPRLAVLVGRGGARKGGTSHPSGELRLVVFEAFQVTDPLLCFRKIYVKCWCILDQILAGFDFEYGKFLKTVILAPNKNRWRHRTWTVPARRSCSAPSRPWPTKSLRGQWLQSKWNSNFHRNMLPKWHLLPKLMV